MSCLTLLAGRAEACLVCIPFPEKTTTDQLLHADVVVLARENSERPFSYIAKKILKGDLDDAAIDLFVNSSTGQRLALYPDQSVVLLCITQAYRIAVVSVVAPTLTAKTKISNIEIHFLYWPVYILEPSKIINFKYLANRKMPWKLYY